MPIYGYTCQSCGHSLDALQKLSDAPLVDCPECGEPALKRQLSAPRFRLKGAGWYETDFKKDNKRNLAGEAEAAGKDAKPEGKDAKADGKGDSKPDKPAADKPAADKPAKDSSTGTASTKSSAGDKAGAA
jgi:putative FmdB family regulatory protein